LELVSGLASLEPPAKQFTGLFFRLRRTRNLWLLAPNSSPLFAYTYKNHPRKSVGDFYGAGERT